MVRQHGAATWKPLEERVTSTEYALLEVLADAGLPVPRPRLLDLSGTVLPAPYLVLPFVDDATEPRMPASAAVERMAGFLERLHGLDVASRPVPPTLPRRAHPMPELLEYLDAGQEELRRLLEGRAAEAVVPLAESVLHGDFWPGNVLWRGHELVAVIDWEDAAVGDPLSDLVCCRVELACAYGEAAMEAFTMHYLRARNGAIDRVSGGGLCDRGWCGQSDRGRCGQSDRGRCGQRDRNENTRNLGGRWLAQPIGQGYIDRPWETKGPTCIGYKSWSDFTDCRRERDR